MDNSESKLNGLAAEGHPQVFRDDDSGYLSWVSAHPGGYVVNLPRGLSFATSRLHRADCRTISGAIPRGRSWTGPYVKVCTNQLSELEQWATEKFGALTEPCGTCQPLFGRGSAPSTRDPEKRPVPSGAAPNYEIHGPAADRPVVEARAQDYIRFGRLPLWQQHLRSAIRSRCRELHPSADQVLHATFRGGKLANADVENLLLYNIDSFKIAGRNGIRFEHGEGAALTSAGNPYSFGYRYALAPRSGSFDNWREVRTLASFDWVDLGVFKGEKKLAQVWWALTRACAQGAISVGEPLSPDTSFAVRLQVRPPIGVSPIWGGLVKSVFDGVISAFQAHTDESCLEDFAHRLALQLPAHPGEIIELLSEQRCAVLGAVSRLVATYRSGVKWNPRDHDCVAGELLSVESVAANWAIKGAVVEVARP